MRPRARYISCSSCTLVTLRLGDVFDAFGLCLAVEKEWRRRALGRLVGKHDGNRPQQADGIRYDTDNLIGALFEHVWKLYTRWDPRRLTFTSYATGILRKKIQTFIAADLGDAAGTRINPKAHSQSVCESLDALTATSPGDGRTTASTASEHSLVFAYGRGAMDADGGGVTSGSWLGAVRDCSAARGAIRASAAQAGGAQTTVA